MNKVKEPGLFKAIKHFLTVYLPKIKSKSPHTVQTYKSSLNVSIHFLKATKNINLYQLKKDDFRPDYILEYLEWLRSDRGNSDSTRSQRIRCLRIFCKYLAGEDVLSFETSARIQDISTPTIPVRFLEKTLTIDEVKHLLELPNISTKSRLRDRFYIALLYDTGCRNSELLSADLGDIGGNKECSNIKVLGKRKNSRITPLSQEVVAMFKQYVDIFHEEKNFQKPLFYTSNKNGVTHMSAEQCRKYSTKIQKFS